MSCESEINPGAESRAEEWNTAGLPQCALVPVNVRSGLTTSKIRRSKLYIEPNSFADEAEMSMTPTEVNFSFY